MEDFFFNLTDVGIELSGHCSVPVRNFKDHKSGIMWLICVSCLIPEESDV